MGLVFELFLRVSKTTVSPSRSLIWQFNQCLRPCISIYQPQSGDTDISVYVVDGYNVWEQLYISYTRKGFSFTPFFVWRQVPADSPVCRCCSGQTQLGSWSPKRCGIYRVALIYALTTALFSLLKKSHKLHNILETKGLRVWLLSKQWNQCPERFRVTWWQSDTPVWSPKEAHTCARGR